MKGKDVGGPILAMSDFGLRFVAMERIPIGEKISLTAKLVPVGRSMVLPVVIRWCTQDSRYPDRAVVGVEFNGVTADQLVYIQKLREKMRKESTRLNSSHLGISYAVFCLKKKINT